MKRDESGDRGWLAPSGEVAAARQDSQRLQLRLRELFEAALDLEPGERAGFVERETRDTPELGPQLTRLLHQDEHLGDFLTHPFADASKLAPRSSRSEPWLNPGDTLGEHEIVSLLGQGGGGQVYRARQRSLGGRLVALKVMRTRELAPGDRERFLRGARVAAGIHHPHLVEVYDCGEDLEQGLVHYSMRLVEGSTLQDVLEELAAGGQPPGAPLRLELVRRLHEVATALAALHERGVVHLDVKPANILLEHAPRERGWEGSAMLVDFGLLRHLEGDPRLSTVWTTLPYAPPELLLHGRADARADVHALGLCLYDLLSGRSATLRSGRAADAVRLSSLVPGLELDLEAVVHRAIAIAPEARYADARELAEDLGAFLRGAPVRARRLTAFERARRWVRRHPERVLRWGMRSALYGAGGALAGLGLLFLLESRSAVHAAERAWERADLEGLVRETGHVPSLLRPALLGGELRGLLDSLASPTSPLARVVGEEEARGEAAGLTLAARFLELDGLARHPELARVLLHAATAPAVTSVPEAPGSREGLRRREALELCARLFVERPAQSPEELAAAAPFRDGLVQQLDARFSGEADVLALLPALAGCGDASTAARLMDWVLTRGREVDPESLRVGLQALDAIARRSADCGYLLGLAGLGWDGWLADCAAWLDRSREGSRQDPARRVLQDLLSTLVECRRRAGLAPLQQDLHEVFGRPSERVLAHRHDPELRQRLLDGRFVADLGAELPNPWRNLALIHDLLHLYADPQLWSAVQGQLRGLRASLGPVALHALAAFERGELGERLDWKPYAPDEETHLGAWFEQSDAGWREPLLQVVEQPLSPKTSAEWGFTALPARLWGGAFGVSTRAVTTVTEATDVFLQLGVFGVSEVRLRFRAEARPSSLLRLRLKCQKGCRWIQPHAGQAEVEVSFEGQVQRITAHDSGPFWVELVYSLREPSMPGEHEFSLRLTETSTTTLRLYNAALVDPVWSDAGD